MTTRAIIGLEVMVGLIIVASAIHIILLPLFTINQVIFRSSQNTVSKGCNPISMGDTFLCSIPDGGDSAEGKVSVDER